MLEIPHCSLILIIVIFEKCLVCCVECLRLEQQQCCLSADWSETIGGVHVIIGDVCQLREAFGSSRQQQDIIYIIEGISPAFRRHTVHVGFISDYSTNILQHPTSL